MYSSSWKAKDKPEDSDEIMMSLFVLFSISSWLFIVLFYQFIVGIFGYVTFLEKVKLYISVYLCNQKNEQNE
jgi:hypothetical protein